MLMSLILCLAGVAPAQSKIVNYCEALSAESFLQLEALDKTIDFKSLDTALLDAAVFHYTNLERRKKGKPALLFSMALYRAAQLHTLEMIQTQRLSHTNKKGKGFRDRIVALDKNFSVTGENIANIHPLMVKNSQAYTYQKVNGEYRFYHSNGKEIKAETYRTLAQKLVKAWMDSPGHKENILDTDYTHVGCCIIMPSGMFSSTDIKLCWGAQDFGAY